MVSAQWFLAAVNTTARSSTSECVARASGTPTCSAFEAAGRKGCRTDTDDVEEQVRGEAVVASYVPGFIEKVCRHAPHQRRQSHPVQP